MSYLKIFEEKEHMIYLKLQMFLFFSEALSSLFYVVDWVRNLRLKFSSHLHDFPSCGNLCSQTHY